MTDAATGQFCMLEDYALVRVQGADAADFLQAQLINDLSALSPDRHQLSGWCNPKGRLLAVLRVFRDRKRWFLRLPTELLAPTLQRLRMFVLRARVELQPLEGRWSGMALWGPAAADGLRAAGLPAPAGTDTAVWHQETAVLQVPGRRFELWGPADALRAVADACAAAGFGAAPRTAWELEEIRAGLPEVYAATREQFVPQTLNMDLIGALSFTKGCYPGQEIVARTRYLGKLKRRMYRLRATAPETQAGATIYRPERSGTDPAGTVVRWAPAEEGIVELLASLRVEDAEAGGLRLADPAGPALERLPLPYAVTVEQDPTGHS